MPSYGCETNADKFDASIELRTQEFFTGSRSCRLQSGQTYSYSVSPILTPTGATYTLQFYSTGSNPLTVRGRLSNNTLVSFALTSNTNVTGNDGSTWRRLIYTYQGGLTITLATLNTIEIIPPNTLSIDNISGTITSAALLRSFRMQTGFDNIAINFNLNDVINSTIKVNEFKMEGYLPANNYAEVYAYDPGLLNPYVYVECSSVTITSITLSPLDQLGASYSVACLPPFLAANQRGLFWIKNVGTTPTSPVKFTITLNTLPRILDTATSANFNFPLSIKSIVYP